MAEVFSMDHVLLCLEQLKVRDRRIAELEKESNDFDTEMAIVAKALTAAFEDGRLNANDKRNEQLSDIAESKKWQTEQVDTLRERIAELEAALKYVKDTITHDANGYDAADCIDNAMAGKACALDALLAKARREALEAAADKAKAVGEMGVGRFNSLTEYELRQMAREAKP